MKRKTGWSTAYLLLIFIVMYLPILLVIITSFNDSRLNSVFAGFTLRWYRDLMNSRAMLTALKNSVILGLLSSGAAAVIGTLAAVGMSRAQIRGARTIEYLSTLPIMLPEIILGMVFMVFFALLGLPFGMTTLVIAHTAFCIPYVFLNVKARLVGLDHSIIEAAWDLGAGEIRAFFDITLPLILPAIMSGILLSFAMSFDDVIISELVTGPGVNTLPVLIFSQIKTGVKPQTYAMCTLLFLLTLIMGIASMALSGYGKQQTVKIDSRKSSHELQEDAL